MTTQNGEFYGQENLENTFAEMDSELLEFDDDGEMTEFEDDDDDDGEDVGESESDFEFLDDDDDDGEDAEDAEFIGALAGLAAPLLSKGVGSAIKGISRLVSRKPRRRKLASRRYTSGSVRTGRVRGIPNRSKLTGRIATRSGRNIRFRLPSHVATKSDVFRLKRSVNLNGKALRSVTKGVKANARSIIKVSGKVNTVDRKHSLATTNQNKVLGTVNKRVLALKKELDAVKQQAQTQMMLPLLMGNDLSSITVTPSAANAFDPVTGIGALDVTTSESGGDSSLPLIMMMSGGFGGSSGGGMMNNPMMMFMLIEAMK